MSELSAWLQGCARGLAERRSRSQIPKQKLRHLVHKLANLFVNENLRLVQDRGMRQRLDRRYQDESREVEIDDVDFTAMGVKITSKKLVRVSRGGVDIFEAPGAGNLFV